MRGFEELYGISQPAEFPQIHISPDDLVMLAFDTAKANLAMPEYIKAVVILANKVAALDSSVSLFKHRQPFAPLTGLLASMAADIEHLTQSCMELFEFATANNVLEILDQDLSDNPED